MKKTVFLLLITLMLSLMPHAFAKTVENGWTIQNNGSAEVSYTEEDALDDGVSLKVFGVPENGKVTVSHLIGSTGAVSRNFRVTFYAKGDYAEEKVMVGMGTKTEAANPDIITYMPLSHEKITKTDAGDGWNKYTYIFRGKVDNNSEFKFVFDAGTNEMYLDNISIVYDSATDEKSYRYVGTGILGDGSFKQRATVDSGFDLKEFGWTDNVSTISVSGLPAIDGAAVTPIARVVDDIEGNRMLYAKFNSANWSNDGLVLTKTIGKTGWNNFYITFKAKGAFSPNCIEVGSVFDEHLVRLTDGIGSSFEKPHGDKVSAVELCDGWTQYTVQTFGEGNVFRIKISQGCLDIWIDDFTVKNEDGSAVDVPNNSMDLTTYDSELDFYENWQAVSINENTFAQRNRVHDDNVAVLSAQNGISEMAPSFYQTVEDINPQEDYTVSFCVNDIFDNNTIVAGFGATVENYSPTKLSAMEKTVIKGGWTKYSFTVKPTGNVLVFSVSGKTMSTGIDNVSVKNSLGEELIKNGDFSIKAKPPIYRVGDFRTTKDGNEVKKLEKGKFLIAIPVENNLQNEGMEFTLILSHERNGQMIKYVTKTVKLQANGDEKNPTMLSAEIDISDYMDEDSLEMYLWDNTKSMKSLRSFGVLNT